MTEDQMVRINGEILHYDFKAPYVVSGESLYGALEWNDKTDTIRCHECGEYQAYLPHHIITVHNLSANDYKAKHGLRLSTSLIRETTRQKMVKASINEKRVLVLRRPSIVKGRKPTHPKRSGEFYNIKKLCPAQLMDDIKKISLAVGHTPTRSELRENNLHHKTILHRLNCKSMTEVMQLLDLAPNEASKNLQKYTKIQLHQLLRNFIMQYDRKPTEGDAKRGLIPSNYFYRKYFGVAASRVKV